MLSNIKFCAILTFAIKFHSVVGQWTLTLRQIFSDKTIIGHNKVRGFPRKHLEPKILKESTFPYFPGLSTHLYFGLFVGPGLGVGVSFSSIISSLSFQCWWWGREGHFRSFYMFSFETLLSNLCRSIWCLPPLGKLTFFCGAGQPWFTCMLWYNVENQSIVLFRTILMMWRVRFLAILYYADQWHRLAGSNTDLDPITSGLWLPWRHHDEKDNLSPECAVCKVGFPVFKNALYIYRGTIEFHNEP